MTRHHSVGRRRMAMTNWEELTTLDLASGDWRGAVALLPVAAVEQHGPHLPLGTDAMICDAVIDRAASDLNIDVRILRLPTQRIGVSPEHGSFAGTLSVEPETALEAWTAVGAAVARAGIRRLVVFNSHGGQPGAVDQVAVRLRRTHGLLVVRANVFGLGLPEGVIGEKEQRYGLHGGLVETAMMLAIRPDLVRMGLARDFRSRDQDISSAAQVLSAEAGGIGIGWLAEDLNPDGVTGNAAAATAELGERLLDHHGRRLAALLGDAAEVDWPVLDGSH